jgi:hypothetical protein
MPDCSLHGRGLARRHAETRHPKADPDALHALLDLCARTKQRVHPAAVLRAQPAAVPKDWGGAPNFGRAYGAGGRAYDSDVIYSRRRGS